MNIRYLLLLQRLRESTGDVLSPFLMMVSDLIIGILPVAVVAFIYLCINKKWGYMMMASIFGATIVNQLLKNICCIYRPWIRHDSVLPYPKSIASATGYSFPSGHATTAASFFGSLAMLFKKKWFAKLCFFCIILVGFSRNYLGVHTPVDVAVGSLEGLFMVWIVDKFVKVNKEGKYDWHLLLGGLSFVAAYLVFTTYKSYPVDYDENLQIVVDPAKMITDCYATGGFIAGALIGWFAEKKWIKMNNEGAWYKHLWRVVLAVGTIVFITTIFTRKLSHRLDADWTSFVTCSMIVLTVTVFVPLVDKAIRLYKK